MKNVQKLLTEISEVTRDIETNYPELYKHLDENPLTIPSMDNPKIEAPELENYLNSLKSMIANYKPKN